MDESLHSGDEYLRKAIHPDTIRTAEAMVTISGMLNLVPDKETEKWKYTNNRTNWPLKRNGASTRLNSLSYSEVFLAETDR